MNFRLNKVALNSKTQKSYFSNKYYYFYIIKALNFLLDMVTTLSNIKYISSQISNTKKRHFVFLELKQNLATMQKDCEKFALK